MPVPQQTPAEFPSDRFSGTHREIGREYGEACTEAIALHLDLALERLSMGSQVSKTAALAATATYREFVVEHAGFLDEEIQGVAEGAGLSLAEAYLLQLRAELQQPAAPRDWAGECTTYAVLPEAAADGATALLGQNADLPEFYRRLGVVIHIAPDEGPECLMLTPAGQVSYIGINDRGLGVFGNFLHCDGWRAGFPRYLFTRLALQHDTVQAASAAVQSVPRASSRKLIMLDAHGSAVDLETTPTETAAIHPQSGVLAHSNHFLSEQFSELEPQGPWGLENSQQPYRRMAELMRQHHGSLDVATMEGILRDRDNVPHALCIAPGDEEIDNITFASVIAEPTMGRLNVAVGPPHEHSYVSYGFQKEMSGARRASVPGGCIADEHPGRQRPQPRACGGLTGSAVSQGAELVARGPTVMVAAQLDQRFAYCLYVPRGHQPGDPDTGLAVLVHGTLRTPERYREEFAEFAEKHNCIILCPLFPAGIIEPDDLDNYKYLEYHGIRFDQILLSMVDEVARKYDLETSRFLLHGFSGGGHFAHRFLYLHATRLWGVSIGAPGMITMVDPKRPWHIGTKGLEDKFGIASTLEEMREVPVHMVVGADDTDTWEINNTSGPLWMEGADAAGKTRVERLSALRENYRARASRSGSTCCRASPTRATRSSTRCATSSRPPWARGCA